MEEQVSNYHNFVENQQPLRINDHNSYMNFSNYNAFNDSSFTSSLNHNHCHVTASTFAPLGPLEIQSNQQSNSQNLMQPLFNSNSIQQSSGFRIADPMAQMLQQNNSHEPNQKPVNHVANFTLTPLKSLETQSNQQPNSQNLMQVPFNSNSIQQSSSFRIVDPLAQMVQHNNSHEFNQRPINNQQEFIPRLQHIRNNNNLNSFAAHNQANAIRNHDLRVNQFLNLEQNPNPALWQHFLNLERDLFNINQDLAKLKSLFFSKTEYNA